MLSVPALRERLRLPPERDSALVAIRDQVVGLWEAKTGALWSFREDHVEVLQPEHDRQRVLRVGLRPLATLTKVEERQLCAGSDWVEQALTDYLVIGDRQVRKLGGWWGELVRLTYDGGWTPATCPAEVREACLVQAEFQQTRLSGEMLAVSSQNFEGGGGVFLDAEMHPVFRRAVEIRARRSGP